MLPLRFLYACLIAVTVEGGLILLWHRRGEVLLVSVLCNAITNPGVNLLLSVVVAVWGMGWYYLLVAPLELCVIAVEAIIYRKMCYFSWMRAVITSVVLNLCSWGVALLLNRPMW